MSAPVVPVGTDESGATVSINLAKAPHVLLAGVSGSGKSVGLHALIHGLVTCTSPSDTRITCLDVKRVEFHGWKSAPHIDRIITDPGECTAELVRLVKVMDTRYATLERQGKRSLDDYPIGESPPRLYVFVDELADLLMQDRAQAILALAALTRIAQLGRACGIHLVCATQRPDSTVLPGKLKTNLLTRWVFKVRSPVDSRVALDARGAETLRGAGDSLLSDRGADPVRVQGLFIDDAAISRARDGAVRRYGRARVGREGSGSSRGWRGLHATWQGLSARTRVGVAGAAGIYVVVYGIVQTPNGKG